MDINRVAHAPAAQRVAFILTAALIGWLWAAALFIASSIAGALLLGRSGCSLSGPHGRPLRAAEFERCIRRHPRGNRVRAILLIFPGFITASRGRRRVPASGAPGTAAKFARLARNSGR